MEFQGDSATFAALKRGARSKEQGARSKEQGARSKEQGPKTKVSEWAIVNGELSMNSQYANAPKTKDQRLKTKDQKQVS